MAYNEEKDVLIIGGKIMTYVNNIIVTNIVDLVKIYNKKKDQGYEPRLRLTKGICNEDVVSIDWDESIDKD